MLENTILIIPNNNKKKLLLNNNNLINNKIMTLEELIDKLTFAYNNEAIYYLIENYKFKYEVALIYLNNIKYIEYKEYNNKLDILVKIKKELEENNLLIKDNLFKEYIRNKKIIIDGYDYITNYQLNILKDYNYEIKEKNINNYKHIIYELNTIEDEVAFVANKIIELINNGVDINSIKITNIDENYNNTIKRIFNFYNIPIELNDKTNIYETNIGKYFINNIEVNIENTLNKLKEKFDLENEINLNIYNKIIEICNNYNFNKDIIILKEMLIYDLKHNYVKKNKLKNIIEYIDLKNSNITNEYVFLMNFNNDNIPVIHKDEDYINDKIKEQLDIETSHELNKIEKELILKKIKNINNLIITYKINNNGKCIISNLNEELNYEIKKYDNNYEYSNIYNKILLSKKLDDYIKYGTLDNDLPLLYNNYKDINYRKYDNKFTGIDKNKLSKYIDNKLLLSYSSLNNFCKCGFRYYLNNILKLTVYEETFMTIIGTIFHEVLSNITKPRFNLDIEYNKAILNIDKKFNKKELFFLNKLKKELKFVIETINKQQEYISLDKSLFEEKIYINKDKNIKITFMGIIDKLLYKELPNKTLVAIIDYKTGTPNLDLNKSIYGIDMQLPIYIYLAKNTNKLKNVEIVGFYLQKIINNEIAIDYKNNYEKLKQDNLKLQGYSNANEELLSYFDNNYNDSKLIKSLKTSSKGFYSYSKIIDTKKIELLEKLVDKKIDESIDNILDAKFDINPKRINKDNIGCEFCKFRDICYMKEEDIIDLKEYKNLEFLED